MDVIFGKRCPGVHRKGGPTNLDVEQAANDCGIDGFLVNCLPFHDPAPSTEHIGKHPSSQQGIVRHRLLRAAVKRVKVHVDQAVASGKRTTAIAFWCRSGKHRSVAFADIVEHIMGKLGWIVHRVDYMSWCWGWANM